MSGDELERPKLATIHTGRIQASQPKPERNAVRVDVRLLAGPEDVPGVSRQAVCVLNRHQIATVNLASNNLHLLVLTF